MNNEEGEEKEWEGRSGIAQTRVLILTWQCVLVATCWKEN